MIFRNFCFPFRKSSGIGPVEMLLKAKATNDSFYSPLLRKRHNCLWICNACEYMALICLCIELLAELFINTKKRAKKHSSCSTSGFLPRLPRINRSNGVCDIFIDSCAIQSVESLRKILQWRPLRFYFKILSFCLDIRLG